MTQYQKLFRYPLGSIHAEGFLRQQLELGKGGMTGHLYELEPEMIADPFVKKSYVPAWGDGDQEGWGAEISGNYWTGYIQAAFTLNDPEMIRIATDWVDAVLKTQCESGYLGTYRYPDSKIYEDYNAWGTACGMRGLIAFYEATGRADVLTAIHRCMLWFCENWAGDKKTSYAGPLIIETMIFTYFLTGDERLVRFSEDYLEYLCEHDIFSTSYKSMLNDELHYNSNHTAGLGTNIRMPALVYSATGREELLRATSVRIQKFREKCVQLSGGPVSVSEYLGPVGATTETEYCSFAFFNTSYSYMSCITGEAKYGDYMEEMFYNGAQGARKKDEKAIAYLSAPNQVYATESSSFSGPAYNMQVYSPCYPTACCPVTSVAVVPEFIRGMLLHDVDHNVYAMAYGPCTLRHGEIALRETTLYPFRNRVMFEIDCNHTFALNLRIPEWAESCSVLLNGESVVPEDAGEHFLRINRAWKTGDKLEIVFNTNIKVIHVDDSDAFSKHPIAIKYGALLFSYHIPEFWQAFPGRPMTPLPEGWSWFNVHPCYEESDDPDPHNRMGLRRKNFSWNIALDRNLTADEITVEELPENGYVWSNAPIRLHTHCRKALDLNSAYERRTFEPWGAYQSVTGEDLPLTLEPYGCTNLRITYFAKF